MGKGKYVKVSSTKQQKEVIKWRREHCLAVPEGFDRVDLGEGEEIGFPLGEDFSLLNIGGEENMACYDIISFGEFYRNRDKIYAELYPDKFVIDNAPHTGPYLGVTQDMLSGEVMPKYDHPEAPMDKAHEYFGNIQKVNVKQAEQDFEEVIKQTLATCKEVMISKGREYRRNNDPFHNFNQGAKLTGKTREEVIWGFALKHFISVQDIKADMLQGKMPTEALLNEKYGDLLNYLLIEKASIMSKIKGVK